MPDLIVKRLATGEEVDRIPISNPFSTIRGQEKYIVVMGGMLRKMSEDFYKEVE